MLGFGFHEMNVRRLNLAHFIDKDKITICTGYDLLPAEKTRAIELLRNRGSPDGDQPPNVDMGPANEDCIALLRRRFEW